MARAPTRAKHQACMCYAKRPNCLFLITVTSLTRSRMRMNRLSTSANRVSIVFFAWFRSHISCFNVDNTIFMDSICSCALSRYSDVLCESWSHSDDMISSLPLIPKYDHLLNWDEASEDGFAADGQFAWPFAGGGQTVFRCEALRCRVLPQTDKKLVRILRR